MRQPLRSREVSRIKRRLIKFGYPRIEMLLLVGITGGVGLAASYVLLQSGVNSLPVRYVAATLIAYCAFFLLLWVWLRTSGQDDADLSELVNNLPSGSHDSASIRYEGQGGEFGGGGASGSFGDAGSDSVGDVIGGAVEAEELAVPLIVIAMFVASLFASLWIVYSAPGLFAELVVDGVLAGSLYHRLRRMKSEHWVQTAMRRTIWPFVATMLVFLVSGWAMQAYAPQARTMSDVVAHWRLHR